MSDMTHSIRRPLKGLAVNDLTMMACYIFSKILIGWSLHVVAKMPKFYAIKHFSCIFFGLNYLKTWNSTRCNYSQATKLYIAEKNIAKSSFLTRGR